MFVRSSSSISKSLNILNVTQSHLIYLAYGRYLDDECSLRLCFDSRDDPSFHVDRVFTIMVL